MAAPCPQGEGGGVFYYFYPYWSLWRILVPWFLFWVQSRGWPEVSKFQSLESVPASASLGSPSRVSLSVCRKHRSDALPLWRAPLAAEQAWTLQSLPGPSSPPPGPDALGARCALRQDVGIGLHSCPPETLLPPRPSRVPLVCAASPGA